MSKEALTLKKILLGIGVLLVIGYAVFNSRFLIQGPEITIDNIDSATGGIISEQKTLFLEGNAKHSSFISINGRPIFIDESGNFNEKLLLSNSMSIIDIYAKDKFGKEVRKKIDVVYKGELDSKNTVLTAQALSASSTAETRATSTTNSKTTQTTSDQTLSSSSTTTPSENVAQNETRFESNTMSTPYSEL